MHINNVIATRSTKNGKISNLLKAWQMRQQKKIHKYELNIDRGYETKNYKQL